MGVQTQLSLTEINAIACDDHLLFERVEPTCNGISDSTYIGTCQAGSKYVFKLYEKATVDEVSCEITLLNELKSLNISSPLTKANKIRTFNDKPAVIFSYLKGETPHNISVKKIEAIGRFLKTFHASSYGVSFNNTYRYSKEDMNNTLNAIVSHANTSLKIKETFQACYLKIENLDIKAEHIIHGDLFPDNSKFEADILTGVFDFSDASKSDKNIDLAVVILSWCFDEQEALNETFAKAFLASYNNAETMTLKTLKPYLLYAALYYAMKRYQSFYVDGQKTEYRNYKEYLNKFYHVELL